MESVSFSNQHWTQVIKFTGIYRQKQVDCLIGVISCTNVRMCLYMIISKNNHEIANMVSEVRSC